MAFDFSVVPQRSVDLAGSINMLNRAHIDQRRADAAFNVLRDTYGDIAGDPQRASALQRIELDRNQDTRAQSMLEIQQAQEQRNATTFTGEQGDLAAARQRQGLLEAGRYVQSQVAAGVDPGVAFDAIAGQLNLPPETAAQLRALIVANPDELGDMIAALDPQAAEAPNAATFNAQQDASLNAMRFALSQPDPVAALNSVLGNLNLPPEDAARLQAIAADPNALRAYVESFGQQDQMLARIDAINGLPPADRERALQVLGVITPAIEGERARNRTVGVGQGEAILGLPQMAQNIAQVEDRVEQVFDPARTAAFSSLFGLPSWRGFQEGGLGYLGAVPGTEAANAAADLEGIMGDISAAAYNSLRGGGQITEAERQSVERSYATLQRSQSWESFQRNLREFQLNLYRIYERQQRMAQGDFNDFLMADPTQENWARELFRVDTAGAAAAPAAGAPAAAAPAADPALAAMTDEELWAIIRGE